MDFTLTPRDNEALRRIQTREHIAPNALRTLAAKGYIARSGTRPVRMLTDVGRAFLSLHQGGLNNDLLAMDATQWDDAEAETAELAAWLDDQLGHRSEEKVQARIRLLAFGLLRKGYYTY